MITFLRALAVEWVQCWWPWQRTDRPAWYSLAGYYSVSNIFPWNKQSCHDNQRKNSRTDFGELWSKYLGQRLMSCLYTVIPSILCQMLVSAFSFFTLSYINLCPVVIRLTPEKAKNYNSGVNAPPIGVPSYNDSKCVYSTSEQIWTWSKTLKIEIHWSSHCKHICQ